MQALDEWQPQTARGVLGPGMQLAFCSSFQVWLHVSNKHQSVTMQQSWSVHNLCSGALVLVLEDQEVSA